MLIKIQITNHFSDNLAQQIEKLL